MLFLVWTFYSSLFSVNFINELCYERLQRLWITEGLHHRLGLDDSLCINSPFIGDISVFGAEISDVIHSTRFKLFTANVREHRIDFQRGISERCGGKHEHVPIVIVSLYHLGDGKHLHSSL